MDYEKEYKKLKAGISNAYLYAQTDSTKAVLENILPELVESEDERARKFLVKHVSEWIGCIEHDLKLSSKDVESEEELAMFKAGLAYLERQKEQKPINLHDKIEELCSKYPINKYSMSDEELSAYRQGIHLGATKIAEYLSEQKSIKWSEKDEDIRDTIIRDLKHLGGDMVNVSPAYKEEIDWLKSFFGLC